MMTIYNFLRNIWPIRLLAGLMLTIVGWPFRDSSLVSAIVVMTGIFLVLTVIVQMAYAIRESFQFIDDISFWMTRTWNEVARRWEYRFTWKAFGVMSLVTSLAWLFTILFGDGWLLICVAACVGMTIFTIAIVFTIFDGEPAVTRDV